MAALVTTDCGTSIAFTATASAGMRCLCGTGDSGESLYSYVTWRLVYPSCSKMNQMCNNLAGAYVPAVTVCQMRLF
jgi:hypothetical protein